MREWKIDNALVSIKDKMFNRIWSTASPNELNEILDELSRLEELFKVLNYAYKSIELARGVRTAAVALRVETAPQAHKRLALLRTIEMKARDAEDRNWQAKQDKHWEDCQDALAKYHNECIVQI